MYTIAAWTAYTGGFVMNGSKTGWIFLIVVVVTFIAVICFGILQCKSEINEELINNRVISGCIERYWFSDKGA